MKTTFITLFFAGWLFPANTQVHFAPLQNKQHTQHKRLWLDASAQIAWIDGFYGIGAGGNLHYLNRNHRHFQLRYNFVQQQAILSPVDCEISNIGYMMGFLRARKYSLMEMAIGIGCVSGYNRGDEETGGYWYTTHKKRPFTTIGIPFEADIKFMSGRYAGVGIVIKANLNPEASYISGGFELTLNGLNN